MQKMEIVYSLTLEVEEKHRRWPVEKRWGYMQRSCGEFAKRKEKIICKSVYLLSEEIMCTSYLKIKTSGASSFEKQGGSHVH